MASTAVQSPTGHHSTSFEPLVTSTNGPTIPIYKPHNVHTTLNYFKDPEDGSAPHPSIVGKPETYDRPNLITQVVVNDVRGHEHEYSLDKQGFRLYKHKSVEKDFLDDEQVKAQYYPEVEQLLKDATGATRVVIFDHTIRRAANDSRPSEGDPTPTTPKINLRGPVNRVHIDQSYTAARNRVPHHLPAEADKLLKVRHQIINVWRPIRRILKDPLAVADANSVPDSDLVPIGLWYEDRKGETYAVRPGKGHKWYYLYGQDVDEVTLIKCYDSKTDGRARRVPHTAFSNPEHEEDYSRESVEVRTLVFYEDQDAE